MRPTICRLLFLVLFAIPGSLAAGTAPLDTVTLQLRWWHQFQFAGYYAAEELGYYRAEGLAVRILPGKTTDFVAAQVANGDAEYGVSGTDILVTALDSHLGRFETACFVFPLGNHRVAPFVCSLSLASQRILTLHLHVWSRGR